MATRWSLALTDEEVLLVVSRWQRQTILAVSERMAAFQLGEAFLNTDHADAARAQNVGDAAATDRKSVV